MSISHTVLGNPGEDNALYVVVDTGQSRHPLLFDCGEGCAARLRISECQAIEHLCFSHYHMDHVAGFDTFFRHNYNRPEGAVNVWGPEQTIDVMHHRFRGFSWNLHQGQPGKWHIHEIDLDGIQSATFLTTEAFATRHEEPTQQVSLPGAIITTEAYNIEACILNHGSTPSIGYRIIEPPRRNIDTARLTTLKLNPGPWLARVTDASVADTENVTVGEMHRNIGEMRQQLLVTRPGASLAYLTDFALAASDRSSVINWLQGTDTLVCEAQYQDSDAALAAANHHMTTQLVGELARDANVGELVLQHVSRRYNVEEWKAMLTEAQSVFAATRFPTSWRI